MAEDYLLVESTGERAWKRLLTTSMAIPGAKVDRASFLFSQLSSHCNEDQVMRAIRGRPTQAGVSPEVIDMLADSSIRGHVLKASGISFAVGLPGGWVMAGTIPADLAQFYWHALVLAQKLAYLYGWPDLLESGEVDEETEMYLTLLLGAMVGAAAANRALGEVAKRTAGQVARRVPRMALTKTAWYPIVRQVGKWIGIAVTKRGFASVVSKAVPIIGGAISAGVTAATMQPMAKRLKNHLKTLRYALPDEEREAL